MDSTPPQDASKLHHRLNEMEAKMRLLENVAFEILTSINSLSENTKEAFAELQSLKAIPAQNTLLQLQEQATQQEIITTPTEIAATAEIKIEDTIKEPETPINEEAPNVEETKE